MMKAYSIFFTFYVNVFSRDEQRIFFYLTDTNEQNILNMYYQYLFLRCLKMPPRGHFSCP